MAYLDIDQSTQTVTAILTILDDRTDLLRTAFIGATGPASPTEGDRWLDTSASPYVLKLYADFDGGGATWHEILVASAISSDLEVGFNELKEARVENLAAAEAVNPSKDGFIYFLTSIGELEFVDGSVDAAIKRICAVQVGTDKDHLELPLTAIGLPASNPPTAVEYGTSPVVKGYLFDATNEKYTFAFRVPDNYSEGGDCYLDLLCALAAAETANDDIDWSGDIRTVDDGDDVTGTSTALAASLTDIAANNGQYKVTLCSLTLDYDDANNPLAKGKYAIVEIYRTDLAEVAGVAVIMAQFRYPCDHTRR